jgi:hypothetical protein
VAKQLKASNFEVLRAHKAKKGTSIGAGEVKRSSMSRHQKRNFKAYRGQGR